MGENTLTEKEAIEAGAEFVKIVREIKLQKLNSPVHLIFPISGCQYLKTSV